MNFAEIDFEYNQSKEPKLNLVCCSIKVGSKTKNYWLHHGEENDLLVSAINTLHDQGIVFLAFAVTAEARSFLSLYLDPLKYRWIDLYLEYRQLLNHNHKLMYGYQLKNGRKVETKPPKPKWERTEQDEKEADNSKPEYNLAAACFKLLNKKIDTGFKKSTRDLIISKPEKFTEEEKEQIIQYCNEDVEYLYPLYRAMIKEYKLLLGDSYQENTLRKEMFWRAEYACRTAIMEEIGYPIDYEMTKNFSRQVPNILLSCQRDIIKQFPDNPPFYKFKRKEGTYTLNTQAIKEEIRRWLEEHPRSRWMLTDGGKSGKKDLSLSLKAFQRHFNYTHNYPKGNYFAQLIRFLKLKQNLNGFMPGGKTNFWDFVGSDKLVRPYMGIYSAQSSRSQPKASGFIPLKSAWMRYLIYPPEGKAMGSIDWASQEYLVSALLSRDKNMIKSYESGDVYLSFLKDCGVVPLSANKKTHGTERNMAKPIILGQQYDLTKFGLSKQLTETTGRNVPEDEAQEWIDKHKKAYPTLWKWKTKTGRDYKLRGNLKLPDGWYLWGDNDNFRSVGNVPTQGLSACIMRKAVQLAQDSGLKVTYTLHDALYIIEDKDKIRESMSVLADCMDEAFRFYMPNSLKDRANCRLDGDIWGPGIEEENITIPYAFGAFEMPTKCQPRYIDERGIEELEFFKEYLVSPDEIDYENMEF